MAEKKPAGRPKQNYTQAEAAEFLGWSEADLLRNFYRGIEPGKSSVKLKSGVRVWKADSLKAAKKAAESKVSDSLAPGGSAK